MIYTLPSGKATIETDLHYTLSETNFRYQQKGLRKSFRESMMENLKMQEKIKELENTIYEMQQGEDCDKFIWRL